MCALANKAPLHVVLQLSSAIYYIGDVRVCDEINLCYVFICIYVLCYCLSNDVYTNYDMSTIECVRYSALQWRYVASVIVVICAFM